MTEALLAILDGSSRASAFMPWGKPGPIVLPDDPDERRALVRAHLSGGSATVTYSPADKAPERVHVPALILAALCPSDDWLCRWIGLDLDASAGHGAGGLADPAHAARCIVERAAHAGLLEGLLVARSRSGQGRHIWFIPPQPVSLEDAVIAVARIAAWGRSVADEDARESGNPHAFRCGDSSVAQLGKAGAVELVPPSTSRPVLGWSMTLPAAGALAKHGGGVLVDPFSDLPTTLETVPRCDRDAWSVMLREARAALPTSRPAPRPARPRSAPKGLLERFDRRTWELLHGRVPEGSRNSALFAATANMVGCGADPHEAERLALGGALACGLSEREARSTIQSALRAKGRQP